ncbi:MAG: 16S rRNA (guanine(966)-N(2))-methyltransferase RsmD [Methylacidiphilales bacterium]|nr:16S rRNA (guanine(966)-N(2))-methyltransferase RsmD [Candidatus Methylacidiphilales bacterium]MDW8348949.1 16S rRNA (guanine(966)-N(2))-methyltransferase RsmD [Verrucomicrobiae bacterium]
MAHIRIIAGMWRGRCINVARCRGLKPTQGRVREAVFSMLGPEIIEARVLDLCAGTGAYGIEAYSRGASSVSWVEVNRDAVKMLRKNLRALKLESNEARIYCEDVFRWLKQVRGVAFDIIFADPPYDWPEVSYLELFIHSQKIAHSETILVLETSSRMPPVLVGGNWCCYEKRKYGETCVSFYNLHQGLNLA